MVKSTRRISHIKYTHQFDLMMVINKIISKMKASDDTCHLSRPHGPREAEIPKCEE